MFVFSLQGLKLHRKSGLCYLVHGWILDKTTCKKKHVIFSNMIAISSIFRELSVLNAGFERADSSPQPSY